MRREYARIESVAQLDDHHQTTAEDVDIEATPARWA
jgi:hypothetical protein